MSKSDAKRKAESPTRKNNSTVRIELDDKQAQSVFIAGTFNDWHPAVTPMLAMENGKWVKELSLPPGRYEYRLVVDGEWKCNPAVKEQAPNSFGGFNSIMMVPAESRHSSGKTISKKTKDTEA